MTRRKHKHLTRYIAIAVAVIVVVAVATVAASFWGGSSQQPQTPASTRTLSVGDTFTYKLAGSTVLGSSDAVTPEEFMQYNDTDYYKVSVTAIAGSQVSLETAWRFKNGTEITSPQVIDLSTGATGALAEFGYLYPSNLNVTDKLYPDGTSKLAVNATSTQEFADSTRTINSWSTADQYMNTGDQTGNTMRYDFITVNFDKQTGMLVSLTRIEFFTNPEIQLTITWQLESSNVWAVK